MNPYASTESQKILFPQQYLQRNKTNMTLFQVALPSILEYLPELKRSGPLLSLLRLHLLSLSAWNSQVEIFSVLIHPTLRRSLEEPCNLFLWLRSRFFSGMSASDLPSGLLICYSHCPPTLSVIFAEKGTVVFMSM